MDLIDREQVISKLEDLIMSDLIKRQDAVNFMREYRYTNISSETIINMIPSAEKTGKWEPYLNEGLIVKCSVCGSRYTEPWHYCPNCGARMEQDI